MSAVADGQIEPVVASEVHARNDVSYLLSAEHGEGPLAEQTVVNGARLVVTSVITGEHRPSHLLTERLNAHPTRRLIDSHI